MEKPSPGIRRGHGLRDGARDTITQLQELVANISSGAASDGSSKPTVTQEAGLAGDRIPCRILATWKVLQY
jgi:hypothetical protein